MRVRIEVTRLVNVGAILDATVTAALADVAEACLEDANRTVPLEEGSLQGSGFAEAHGLEAQVAYGTPYAVYQHEDASLRHDAGRRDHWLEQTLYENADRYVDHIAQRVSARLGGGA